MIDGEMFDLQNLLAAPARTDRIHLRQLPADHAREDLVERDVGYRGGLADGPAIAQLDVRASGADAIVGTLSGGNQQKILLARRLNASPKIFILDEPTRGIDIGAKVEIHKLLDHLARQGVAIIIISSELEELLGMSDRILVMNEGRIVSEFTRDNASREAVMEWATGARRPGN